MSDDGAGNESSIGMIDCRGIAAGSRGSGVCGGVMGGLILLRAMTGSLDESNGMAPGLIGLGSRFVGLLGPLCFVHSA